MDAFKQQVMNDSRIEASRKVMSQKIMRVTGFTENSFPENELWNYTDSSLLNKKLPTFPDLDANTPLFSFTKKKVSVRDWVTYRNSIKNVFSLTKDKSNRAILDEYEKTTAYDYYRAHLEDYNSDFAHQFQEFKDGNLLFEIMQRKVWDKASSDSVGLRAYYEDHKAKYWWEPSADVILFTCSSEKTAEDVKRRMKSIAADWRRITDSSNGLVQADSGRFETAQIPPADKGQLQAGQFSAMQRRANDNTLSMAYIIKTYGERNPRNFYDAKGLVINDYQSFLEGKWISELKQKYPVKVDVAVMKTLPK